MKEICMQISRLDGGLPERSYMHCLTAALEDLALKDI